MLDVGAFNLTCVSEGHKFYTNKVKINPCLLQVYQPPSPDSEPELEVELKPAPRKRVS